MLNEFVGLFTGRAALAALLGATLFLALGVPLLFRLGMINAPPGWLMLVSIPVGFLAFCAYLRP